ncbi:hypothetical protein [Motilimonas sp. KMU-193]|uniref:hypothetical protein n=1 Tax=Motilimonas sp. KMU-193 TaxID=3388668 RepID=UPI00396B2C6B
MGTRLKIGSICILLLSCLYELILVRNHFDILSLTIFLQSLEQFDVFYPKTTFVIFALACARFATYLFGIEKKTHRIDHMARYITIRKLVANLNDVEQNCSIESVILPMCISYRSAYIAQHMYPQMIFKTQSTDATVKPDMTFLKCQEILATLERYYWLAVICQERYTSYHYDEQERLLEIWHSLSEHFFGLKTILNASCWFENNATIEYKSTFYRLAFTTVDEIEQLLDMYLKVYRPLLSMADEVETISELEKSIADIKTIHQEEKVKIDNVLRRDQNWGKLKEIEKFLASL